MSGGIDVNGLLADLEDEERRLSQQRSRLHQRIEYARTNGDGTGSPALPEQLAALDKQERELSQARRDLHARINELRSEPEDR
jgi:hypothetical protein